MTNQPKILAFAGSSGTKSLNKKLVKIAAHGAESEGAQVTYLDLRDIPMPIYDEDLEANEGMSENVLKFRELMRANQGLLISSPEYNGSISGLLKNAIDWASRPDPESQPKGADCFKDKVAALMTVSPGALGGIRGLVHVRAILGNLGVIVLPEQRAISHGQQAFNEDSNLKDEKQQASIIKLGTRVTTVVSKLF